MCAFVISLNITKRKEILDREGKEIQVLKRKGEDGQMKGMRKEYRTDGRRQRYRRDKERMKDAEGLKYEFHWLYIIVKSTN